MKTKNLYLLVFIFGLLSWSCSKTSLVNTNPATAVSLKSSLTQGVQDLSSAVTSITTSAGYQVVNGPTDLLTKSAVVSPWDTVTHSVLLADIAGVYDYKATQVKRNHMPSIMRFFNKTKDSTLMVIRLPEEKVKASKKMFTYSPSDTLLTNNYKITVSDYQVRTSHATGSSYEMASAINIKGVAAGTYKITTSQNKTTGYHFASEFDFPNGFVTKCYYTPGDTAVSVYSISDGTKVLYEEKYTAIKSATDNKHREKEFSLTIGNVEIVRQLGHSQASLDSAKVYVAGVLQLKSKVEIVDKTTDPTADKTDDCISNQKRDLKITFDDGTTKTLSELTGSVITDISALFTSLREANFGTAIIDWIAGDIYFKKLMGI